MKEQIEEMAVEFAKINCNPKGCYNCNLCDEYGSLELSCEDYLYYRTMAETFYNAGYRKVPEGAMILTRAELDALNKYQERFKGQDAEAVIATEVAKEIFEESEDIFKRRIAFYTDMAKQSKFTSKYYAETMITNCKIYLQELVELKKKYTEEGK